MKKIFLVVANLLAINTALPKVKNEVILRRNPCYIAYDNSYNYYVSHGVEACQAQEYCVAALQDCLRQNIPY
jgi:hypothetical protein